MLPKGFPTALAEKIAFFLVNSLNVTLQRRSRFKRLFADKARKRTRLLVNGSHVLFQGILCGELLSTQIARALPFLHVSETNVLFQRVFGRKCLVTSGLGARKLFRLLMSILHVILQFIDSFVTLAAVGMFAFKGFVPNNAIVFVFDMIEQSLVGAKRLPALAANEVPSLMMDHFHVEF